MHEPGEAERPGNRNFSRLQYLIDNCIIQWIFNFLDFRISEERKPIPQHSAISSYRLYYILQTKNGVSILINYKLNFKLLKTSSEEKSSLLGALNLALLALSSTALRST